MNNKKPQTLADMIPQKVRDALDEIGPIADKKEALLNELKAIDERIAELDKIVRDWVRS